MSEKSILLIIDGPPGFAMAEKLRMGVGLTLEDDNKVKVLFIDEGACLVNGARLEGTPAKMEIDKSLQTLEMMGVELLAHAPSIDKRGVDPENEKLKLLDDGGLESLLAGSSVVIT